MLIQFCSMCRGCTGPELERYVRLDVWEYMYACGRVACAFWNGSNLSMNVLHVFFVQAFRMRSFSILTVLRIRSSNNSELTVCTRHFHNAASLFLARLSAALRRNCRSKLRSTPVLQVVRFYVYLAFLRCWMASPDLGCDSGRRCISIE